MNKPLKLLLVLGVLAFAAAGLYYAMVSPARSGKAETKLTRQDQSGGPKFDAGNTLPPTVVVGKEPAGSWPSPLPAESKPAVPAASTTVSAPAPQPAASNAVPGFSPAADPMKPLPNALPGFEPVRADGAPAKAAPADAITPGSPAPNATPNTTLTPATPVVTQGTASSTGSAGTTSARPAPAAAPAGLPPLPAPAKPAPATAAPKTTTAVPASKSAPADTYTVKEGDSIASIWRSISGSERGWEKLLAANPGVDPSRLKIGQVLKVPDHKAAASTETKETAPAAAKPAASGTYTVQSGDTLSRIAAKTLGDSKRWKEIYEANRDALGNDPGALEVGQSLKIPGKGGATKPAAAKPAEKSPEPKPVSSPAPNAPPAGVIGGSSATAPSTTSAPAPTASPTPR